MAENGQVAVDKYQTGSFNLGLFDIQMPLKVRAQASHCERSLTLPSQDGVEAAHDIRMFEKDKGLSRCRIVSHIFSLDKLSLTTSSKIALTGLSGEADMEKAKIGRTHV